MKSIVIYLIDTSNPLFHMFGSLVMSFWLVQIVTLDVGVKPCVFYVPAVTLFSINSQVYWILIWFWGSLFLPTNLFLAMAPLTLLLYWFSGYAHHFMLKPTFGFSHKKFQHWHCFFW